MAGLEIDAIPVTTQINPEYGTLTSAGPDLYSTFDGILNRVAGLGSAWADFELRKHELGLAYRYQQLDDLNNLTPGNVPGGSTTTAPVTTAGFNFANLKQNQLVTFAVLGVGLFVAVTSK